MNIGTFVLPHGVETACGILSNIYQYLDTRSLLNIKESSIIKQLKQIYQSNDFERKRDEALTLSFEGFRSINELLQIHAAKKLYLLIERYKNEFPRGTPFVCACQHRRMDDVELFVNLHPFHKYITNHDGNMTLRDMVSQVGKNSDGHGRTPLMIAATREDFKLVNYLIEQGADPNVADDYGLNALHFAAWKNRSNTGLIQLLLNHMTLHSVNQELWVSTPLETTPLDLAYRANHSPIRQEIIDLMRSKGAKANRYDENGRRVE
tara:strand:+ start:16 stop:807 length:792 start_codon:yes stop_codon:yes gene_type:complete